MNLKTDSTAHGKPRHRDRLCIYVESSTLSLLPYTCSWNVGLTLSILVPVVQSIVNLTSSLMANSIYPVSILYKSIAGRYRPVSVADGPITARYGFIKNASWVTVVAEVLSNTLVCLLQKT